ncbi:tubulin-tyrosine ligase [Infundibulicybe gibba]|nr:tubulin-tyrosine ligase [Infundibulicybe gibba]
MTSNQPAVALVSWPNAPLTNSLVLKSLSSIKNPPAVASDSQELLTSSQKIIQWSSYDQIDHTLTHSRRDAVLSSSYIFRKALIRKHFLSRCIHSYVTKYTTSILKGTTPRTYELEISFADELDEMWTDELWDLGQALEDSNTWWILKPGMADRGMGIRLFNTKAGLEQIFQEFEGVDSDDEDVSNGDGTAVVTSQLRHFVVQEYILNPLLIDPSEALTDHSRAPLAPAGHKFHLRAYCVASGALSVYLYDRVLALFSSVPYQNPATQSQDSGTATLDLTPHLTNTSLQTHRGDEGVRLLEELVGCHTPSNSNSDQPTLTTMDVAHIVGQMVEVLAETFKAALATPIHFQPLENAFELYGVDFLIASDPGAHKSTIYTVKLLEINAEPAIELTGPRLTWILEDLFIAIGNAIVEPFISPVSEPHTGQWPVGETHHHLIKCLQTNVRN